MFSFSSSVQNNRLETVSVDFVIDMIRSDKGLKDNISLIRSISDNQLRQEKKKELLPMFNPGLFKGNIRKNENLEAIEFLTFDFDHLSEDQYNSVLTRLKKDRRTFLIFRTPSGGHRLKALFRLESPLRSQKAYESVFLYYHKKFSETLKVEIDQGYKNSQLGSYLSYDPELFHNPGAQRLSININFQKPNHSKRIPDGGEYDDLSNLHAASEFLHKKIKDWSEYEIVLYSLASIGERGRSHFISICSDNPDYPKDTPEHLSKEFDRALNSYDPEKPDKITIRSFFFLAREKGFRFPEKKFDYTEMGLAERMSYHYHNRLKYSKELRRWFIWNGRKWAEDKTKAISDYYKMMLEKLKLEYKSIEEPEKQKKISQLIRSARSNSTFQNVIKLLESEKMIRIEANDLDACGSLLNCDNVLIRMCGGKVEKAEHSPEYLITKITKARFVSGADCPKWKEFLNSTFKGDESLIGFIQRMAGYCLTSETSEEVFFYLHGGGGNGKTTFIETLGFLLGDYYQKIPIDTFLSSDRTVAGQANPELVMLKGSRLAAASEVPSYKPLNERLIKDLTGGDSITQRPLYGEYITYKPVCKLMFYGNPRPVLRSMDNGIRRRLLLIPFENAITKDKKRGKNLIFSEFQAELPGILNWALDGYVLWSEQGLNPPPAVCETTEDYFYDNDPLQQYINENCTISSSENIIAKSLYDAYAEFLREKGETVPPSKQVYEKLREKGFKVKKGTANKLYIFGLNLISEEDCPLL